MWGIIITLILISLFLIWYFGIRKPKPPVTEPHEAPGGDGNDGNGGAPQPPAAVFPLQVGMAGDSVKSVQNKLKKCFKYSSINPTGVLDKDTGYALGSLGYPLPMTKSQWNTLMASSNCR